MAVPLRTMQGFCVKHCDVIAKTRDINNISPSVSWTAWYAEKECAHSAQPLLDADGQMRGGKVTPGSCILLKCRTASNGLQLLQLSVQNKQPDAWDSNLLSVDNLFLMLSISKGRFSLKRVALPARQPGT